MHELAVTESVLRIALDAAEKNDAARVTDIYLTIGRFSSIVDDSVQFYWDHISKETICAGATLHFNRPPAVLHCLDCGQDYVMEDFLEPCPNCGSVNIRVISGEELQVDHIDIQRKEEQ